MDILGDVLRRFRAGARSARAGDPCRYLRLCEGTIADYGSLARFHYRGGRPATCERILMYVDASGRTGGPAAVLVVSRPVLNGWWRARLWPGRFQGGPPWDRLARLNADLRTISRVVVDPRWRGIGVARRLVRAYLDDPLTELTEAVAAMGVVCPFFERAGMRAEPLEPTPRNAKLMSALTSAGFTRGDLADPVWLAQRIARRPTLVAALRKWAASASSTRAAADGEVVELVQLAARKAACAGVAYAWERT